MASIHAGQRVYRKNGALIGHFLRTIGSGQAIMADDFIYYDGSRPRDNAPVDPEIMDFVRDTLAKGDE